MGEDSLTDLTKILIEEIEMFPAVNSDGLNNTLHPDALILAMHNHLGNAHQMIDSSITAANGTEQFLILKNAHKELDGLVDNLRQAEMTGVLSREQSHWLIGKARDLMNKISDTVDTEYA